MTTDLKLAFSFRTRLECIVGTPLTDLYDTILYTINQNTAHCSGELAMSHILIRAESGPDEESSKGS